MGRRERAAEMAGEQKCLWVGGTKCLLMAAMLHGRPRGRMNKEEEGHSQ